ncbi:hypothetical protein LX82_03053 [Celeribacter halophilus]|uniref:Uncharacterized protein n=1 Tax=Celeribacter halophilus TaxID=576117 RepID=A0A1I3VN13_9RHOB|nr:hypothetical protein LX82_03053 [Celeribacter halophilus]SFJ96550.1 hypothetical protein SAMN04488138_11665 [Celeribacter halophilus]
MKVGDGLQGAAADCNSAEETHAWFDSRVAHHFHKKNNVFKDTVSRRLEISRYNYQWVIAKVSRTLDLHRIKFVTCSPTTPTTQFMLAFCAENQLSVHWENLEANAF